MCLFIDTHTYTQNDMHFHGGDIITKAMKTSSWQGGGKKNSDIIIVRGIPKLHSTQ